MCNCSWPSEVWGSKGKIESPTPVDSDSLDLRSIPVRPLCKMCQRRVTIDILVENDLWRQVIGPCQGSGYVCDDCFTREAYERMIEWKDGVQFIPCSMASQVEIQKPNA